MNKIKPNKVRYIKLGMGGEWEEWCLQNNAIRLGYESPYHEQSKAGAWDIVKNYWLEVRNGHQGAATRDVNQIRDFYELPEDDLWVTFHQRKLYWCRASHGIEDLDDGSRIRKTISPWKCESVDGQPLTIENLDGRVTKVLGYRGTICGIDQQKYLLHKINGEPQPGVEEARKQLVDLTVSVKELIQGLWWHDFELLIDLIFSNSGWQRISVLGKRKRI